MKRFLGIDSGLAVLLDKAPREIQKQLASYAQETGIEKHLRL